jgi:hypothetical protein
MRRSRIGVPPPTLQKNVKSAYVCSEKFGLDPLTRRCAPPSPPRGRGQGYFSCFAGVAKRHDKLHCKAVISCFFGVFGKVFGDPLTSRPTSRPLSPKWGEGRVVIRFGCGREAALQIVANVVRYAVVHVSLARFAVTRERIYRRNHQDAKAQRVGSRPSAAATGL